MLFVTVGQTLPFDRLVRMVDDAMGSGLLGGHEVFAQIGDAEYTPRHLIYERFLDPIACEERFASASAVIGHAGVGTVMKALHNDKVLIAVPRRPNLGECVDNHQVKTARVFSRLRHILAADDIEELGEAVRSLQTFVPKPREPRVDALCDRLSSFLQVCDADRAAPASQVRAFR